MTEIQNEPSPRLQFGTFDIEDCLGFRSPAQRVPGYSDLDERCSDNEGIRLKANWYNPWKSIRTFCLPAA